MSISRCALITLRQQKGLSVDQLAINSGIEKEALLNIESDGLCSQNLKCELANALNVAPESLDKLSSNSLIENVELGIKSDLEGYVRNLEETQKKTFLTILKVALADHIRFLRNINTVLITCPKNIQDLWAIVETENNCEAFGSWFNSIDKVSPDAIGKLFSIYQYHEKLHEDAITLAKEMITSQKIPTTIYEHFLESNDHFVNQLWQLVDITISSQFQYDHLTQLLNPNAFKLVLEHEVARATHSDSESCLVLIDLDNFKNITNKYSKAISDEVIKEFSELLETYLRQSDYICRYSNKEFLICLPSTRVKMAMEIITRFKFALEKAILFSPGDESISITASFGISTFEGSDYQITINTLNESIIQAKLMGGNQVIFR